MGAPRPGPDSATVTVAAAGLGPAANLKPGSLLAASAAGPGRAESRVPADSDSERDHHRAAARRPGPGSESELRPGQDHGSRRERPWALAPGRAADTERRRQGPVPLAPGRRTLTGPGPGHDERARASDRPPVPGRRQRVTRIIKRAGPGQ